MNELLDKGWVVIFMSTDGIDVNLKKSKLAANGIEAVTFNHQDTMLKSLNDTNFMVSLFVHGNDLEKSKEIIENN